MSVRREDLFGGGEGAGEGDSELLAVCDFVVLFEFSGLEVVRAVDKEVDLLGVEVADGGGSSGALLESAGHRIARQDLEFDEDHLGRERGRMADVVND